VGSTRARGERGASLLIALAILALFGATVPALLDLAGANFLATSRLHEQRADIYTADGSTDAAIQYLRSHPNCGRPFQTVALCPISTGPSTSVFSATLNGQTATTTITAQGTVGQLDRTVGLSTSVNGADVVQAIAIIRDSSTAAEPPVDVQSWTRS
jgi:hypothetical protein